MTGGAAVDGVFEVVLLGPGRARFLDLPLGAVGVLTWRGVAPAFRRGPARSLRTMARRCEAARRG